MNELETLLANTHSLLSQAVMEAESGIRGAAEMDATPEAVTELRKICDEMRVSVNQATDQIDKAQRLCIEVEQAMRKLAALGLPKGKREGNEQTGIQRLTH